MKKNPIEMWLWERELDVPIKRALTWIFDQCRYWWNWLLSKGDWQLLAGGFVFGCAAGVLAYDIRSDWLTNGLLVSLESECQSYMGQRAMLIYHERRFYCLPERPKEAQ